MRTAGWRIFGPFGMWRKLLPFVSLEKLFPEAELTGTGEIHCVVPRNVAVVAAVRRFAVRLLAAVALPDAVSAVRMARGAIGHAKPKHFARPLRRQAVVQHFVG